MKKFKIHLTDDDRRFENQVKSALFTNAETCDKLVDFQYFRTVGSAKKYYQESGSNCFPDVALVDIKFMESDLPEGESGETKGIELARYLIENASECTKVYIITAFGHDNAVASAIDQLDLIGQDIAKGSEIGAQVRIRVQKELQKRATNILRNLPQNERIHLRALPELWGAVEVDGFPLPQLLAGWGDMRTQTSDEVQTIINKMMEDEPRRTLFAGNWAKIDSLERETLHQYNSQSRAAYEQAVRQINATAFNLLLEIIWINKNYEDGMKVHLSHREFKDFSVTQTITARNPKAFFYKMVGRRVALAMEAYVDRTDGLSLNEIAFLFRDGFFDNKGDQPDPKTPVFTTNLGLFISGRGNIVYDEQHRLPEEDIFLENFGQYAEAFFSFLSDFDVPVELGQHLPEEGFKNMAELKRMMDLTQSEYPAEILTKAKGMFWDELALVNVPANIRRAIFGLYGIIF